jgi:hypothetical protein
VPVRGGHLAPFFGAAPAPLGSDPLTLAAFFGALAPFFGFLLAVAAAFLGFFEAPPAPFLRFAPFALPPFFGELVAVAALFFCGQPPTAPFFGGNLMAAAFFGGLPMPRAAFFALLDALAAPLAAACEPRAPAAHDRQAERRKDRAAAKFDAQKRGNAGARQAEDVRNRVGAAGAHDTTEGNRPPATADRALEHDLLAGMGRDDRACERHGRADRDRGRRRRERQPRHHPDVCGSTGRRCVGDRRDRRAERDHGKRQRAQRLRLREPTLRHDTPPFMRSWIFARRSGLQPQATRAAQRSC